MSLCALTAAQALFFRLGLPSPFEWDTSKQQQRKSLKELAFILYGASTSVGLYAAQLVRFGCEKHGVPLKFIGTASSKHFATLEKQPYGYDVLVDYRETDWPEQIRKAAGSDGLEYGINCISEGALGAHSVSTNFSPYDFGIIDAVARELRPGIVRAGKEPAFERWGIVAELYQLNVYSGPSGIFKSHVDTPSGRTHFGSLVIALPTKFQGNTLTTP